MSRIPGIHAYFSSTLSLYTQLNLEEALQQLRIFPSTGGLRRLESIAHALTQASPGKSPPVLYCVSGKLLEVRYCISKTMKFTPCVEIGNWTGESLGCPKQVLIPPLVTMVD